MSLFKRGRKLFITLIISLMMITGYAGNVFAKILVVSPHPDDDIITASGIIAKALQRGEQVKIVYMTNGDIRGYESGLNREQEAVNAAVGVLGMTESNLVFLGYPDSYLTEMWNYYVYETDAFTNDFGQDTTYANRGVGQTDYHTYRFGSAAKYNRYNLLKDMKDLLDVYRPDHIIITSDDDVHADHATTYLALTTALNQLASQTTEYYPVIHKTVVHSEDYDWPLAGNPIQYFSEPPDSTNTNPDWALRESYDVPVSMQSSDLDTNPKALAIACHISQGEEFLGRFVHKDEFFWSENILGSNQPPVVNAGTDQTVNISAAVQLDGSSSFDPEGTALVYQWTQVGGTAVTLSNSNVARPTFTAPSGITESETLTFQLVVSDGRFSSLPDAVNVKITPQNIARLATATASSQNSDYGQLASKVIDGTIDGYPGDYTKEWAAPGQGVGAWVHLQWNNSYSVNRIVLYDRPNLNDQITSATITFSDGSVVTVGQLYNNGAATEVVFTSRIVSNLTVTVNSVSGTTGNVGLSEIQVYGASSSGSSSNNHAPVADAGCELSVRQGKTGQLDASGSYDSDNDVLSYSWTQTSGTAVTLSNSTISNPTFTAPSNIQEDEVLTFELTVSDYQYTSSASTVNVTVISNGVNVASMASITASSQNSDYGQLATRAIDGTIDGYPGDYTKEWATQGQGAGAWIHMQWSKNYQISSVVLFDRPNTNDRITGGTLTFSDGSTVAVGALNNDGSGTEITFSKRSISNMTFTVTSVSGTTGNAGLAEIQVFGNEDTGSSSGNSAPVANAGSNLSVRQGATAQLDGSGSSDPDNDSLTYQWTQTSGTAVTLSNSNISNPTFTAPSQDDVLTFQLTVSDYQYTSAAATVTVTVFSDGTNIASLATVTASGQNSDYGQLATKAVDGYIDGYPGDYTREWAAPGGGVGTWLNLQWQNSYTVSRVVLYDRPNENDRITGGTLNFSDGSSVTVGALNNNGSATEVTFTPRSITSITFTITSVSGTTGNAGLSEFQVYGILAQ